MQGLIRRMEAKDIARVQEIERQGFANPWSEQSFLSELENPISHMLVLETEEGIVGMMGYWMVLDEMHLLTIAVDEMHRGRGLARFLMHAMLSHGKEAGVKQVVLEVRENNDAAIRLYERYGFSAVGRIANYYPEEKQDAIIMRKEIQ